MKWPHPPSSGSGGRARPEPWPRRVARFLRRVFYVLLSLTLISVAAYCAWGMHRFIYRSGYFTVRDIQIRGASDALKKDARVWLEKHLKANDNLCRQNKTILAKLLCALPRAKSATVSKVYPNILRVDFTERQPVIVAKLDEVDDLFLMDEEGVLVARTQPEVIHRLRLPILTGIHGAGRRPGDRIKQERLADVLKTVCYIHDKEALLDKMIVEWNLNGRSEVTAIMNTHTEVRFGDRAPIEMLDKLITGLEMDKELENASYIDLRMERQLVYK